MYLTQDEFTRWAQDDRLFKERVLDNLDTLTKQDADHGARIAVLENQAKDSERATRSTAAKWSGGVTTLITIIIQAALAAFSGSKQ